MEKIKIVIVDDSTFSVTLIRDILEEHGFDVVGSAGSLEEVRTVVSETKPSLVTMDMTLPNTDGLECTRAIHEIDNTIKVIVISSMMDDEIVKEAKKNKVSAYIQKPVDAEELITAINGVMAVDELYQFLQDEYCEVFKESLKDSVNRMTKTLITYKDSYSHKEEYESKGLTVIIGIIGMFSGRMLIDLTKNTANQLATAALKREPKDNNEIMDMLAEFTNIIAGGACSILNRKYKSLGLRVAPPSVLYGDTVLISPPNFKTTTIIAKSNYGEILLNTGFKRGDE